MQNPRQIIGRAAGLAVVLLALGLGWSGHAAHAQAADAYIYDTASPVGTLEDGTPVWQDSGAVLSPGSERALVEAATNHGDAWGIVSSILLALVYLIRETAGAMERRYAAQSQAGVAERRHELDLLRLRHLLVAEAHAGRVPLGTTPEDLGAILDPDQ